MAFQSWDDASSVDTDVVLSVFTLSPVRLYLSQLFGVQVTETQLKLAYKGLLHNFIEVQFTYRKEVYHSMILSKLLSFATITKIQA